MRRITLFCCSILLAIALLSCPAIAVAHENRTTLEHSLHHPLAPLLDDLGTYHHPISTHHSLTQRYFDQGLMLTYGFNDNEAVRSFQQATRLDPGCGMCYWGLAYALGSVTHAKNNVKNESVLLDALQHLISLNQASVGSEQAYIQALLARYITEPSDQASPTIVFANAMRELSHRYPDDLDAATLFAKARMETIPWDYWDDNGNLKPAGAEVIHTLESVMQRNPNHPGANHLYIHAVEREQPELGVAAADRMATLIPGSGHFLHMPSHIYMRVGRYEDAIAVNQQAIAADDAYFMQCYHQGYEPFRYMPYHNQHFLWSAALMAGQFQVAMDAAHQIADDVQHLQEFKSEAFQHYTVLPLYTLDRFAQWQKILATPAPDTTLKYSIGVWHYVRGKAFVALNQLKQATQDLERLQTLLADPTLQVPILGGKNSATDLLTIAAEVLNGEMAAKQGNYSQAIAHLKQAVYLEDALAYTEPGDWYQPARQQLGAVLLKADRPIEAEQVYRDDLTIHPLNHWSLQGLAQSWIAQGKMGDVSLVN